jgi:hypothetical protein
MKYTTAAAFRQALDDRLKGEAAKTGLGIARLRKRVAFELFLRRLVTVAPDRWILKGALARLPLRRDESTDQGHGSRTRRRRGRRYRGRHRRTGTRPRRLLHVRRTADRRPRQRRRLPGDSLPPHGRACRPRLRSVRRRRRLRRLDPVEPGHDRDVRPTHVRRHRARPRSRSAAPSTHRGEGARIHPQVRSVRTREHATERPHRHPAHHRDRAARRRPTTRGS